MKSFAAVLVLFVLLALAPCAQCMAQTPQSAVPAASAGISAPAPVADFLETLSSGQGSGAQDQMPSPKFLTTYCSSDDDCPAGELCCYPCGIDGCSNICMQPMRPKGGCPLFV